MDTTKELIAVLEQWLFEHVSPRCELVKSVEDIQTAAWGTATTDWGRWIDGEKRVETYLRTPAPHLISTDARFAEVVKAYMALTNQPDYGKGQENWLVKLPAWYINGTPEPPLLEEKPK